MARSALVTGGAGFIGRHVVKDLLERGWIVRILDNFHEQIHAPENPDETLLSDAEVFNGDIRDPEIVEKALSGMDSVVHLAAEVGVGQSMYEVERYVSVNELGTAVLFQKLIETPIERIVTASSMSVYGEGLYKDVAGNLVNDARRLEHDFGGWDPADAEGRMLLPVATPEWKQPALASIYALNKYVQEQMTHIVAQAYGVDAVTLRLFNVYGPGQALSNPYTGVLAIFASRLLNDQSPLIFEDGEQRRDFVHVSDVARAFASALDSPEAAGQTINIGSGRDISILDVARKLASAMGCGAIELEITEKRRVGDIRHCFADITKARRLLNYSPQIDFTDGLSELATWVEGQSAYDRAADARRELEMRGLVW